MSQISKGQTFHDTEQVTFQKLNDLVDNSKLEAGAITEQSPLIGDIDSNDLVLLYDNTATALRKASISDILGGSLPVVASTVTADSVMTSEVNAEALKDILLTPYDGVPVTGKAFSSIDGITVTVTSTAHGLVNGMFVEISATDINYNGTYNINVFSVDSFTYTIFPETTPAIGTCQYIRKASQRIDGNLFVGGNAQISSNTIIEGNLNVIGSINVIGGSDITGTSNFVGGFQINGVTSYCLYETTEETMGTSTPANGNTAGIWTSAAFTKTADEIWIFEADFNTYGIDGWGFGLGFRYNSVTPYSGIYQHINFKHISGNNYAQFYHENVRWIANVGTTFTAETVKVDVQKSPNSNASFFNTTATFTGWVGFSTVNVTSSKFRIYKYRTA